MNNEVFEKCWGAGCLLFQEDKRVITYYSYYYYVSLGFFLLMFPPRQLLLAGYHGPIDRPIHEQAEV